MLPHLSPPAQGVGAPHHRSNGGAVGRETCTMRLVRIELTTLRLWDAHATSCAMAAWMVIDMRPVSRNCLFILYCPAAFVLVLPPPQAFVSAWACPCSNAAHELGFCCGLAGLLGAPNSCIRESAPRRQQRWRQCNRWGCGGGPKGAGAPQTSPIKRGAPQFAHCVREPFV